MRGLELLVEWGLLAPRPGGVELAARVEELLALPLWADEAPRPEALLAAFAGSPGSEIALAVAAPKRPSDAVELARGHDAVALVLARALGTEWLDDYVARWRAVELEIDGADLIAAGIPPGPALGHGLRTAQRAKLDGDISGRDRELATAVAAARDVDPTSA